VAGPVAIVLDTSVEPTGDIVTPLIHALDDPTVAVAGGWGIVAVVLRARAPEDRENERSGFETREGESRASESAAGTCRRRSTRLHSRWGSGRDFALRTAISSLFWI
jgi:hypothetical protein